MDSRVVVLVLVMISIFWCCHARDLSGTQNIEVKGNPPNVCALCEEFTVEALNYLSENKTQTEVISALHKSCSKIPSFKKQCVVLIDYYVPLFFLEISRVNAGDFCLKVDLCQKSVPVLREPPKDKCELCENAVTEALLKLKDPDTELEIIQLLLKACNKLEKAVKKCKKLVFEYAPIILVNAEDFLEKNDICTILHACEQPAAVSEAQVLLLPTETSFVASS